MRYYLVPILLTAFCSPLCAQWTEPVPMEPQLGTAVWGPWISNDGLRLYASGGGYLDVIERDSVTGPWHEWHSVAAHINSGVRQESPCESPTGDTLYFMSWERPEGCYGGYDIYYCVRADTGWGPVMNCGPNINTEDTEWSVGISRDGSLLLVSAHHMPVSGGLDLYYSEKQPDGWWEPLVNFGPPVSGADYEEHPCMSPGNGSLYFSGPGYHMGDIWVSRRADTAWLPPAPLPAPVNTLMGGEFDPCLSADGRTLWFVRQDEHHDNTLLYSVDTTVGEVRERPGQVRHPPYLAVWTDTAEELQLSIPGWHLAGSRMVVAYDLLGREVTRREVPFVLSSAGVRGSFALKDLPDGTYFLSVRFPGQEFRAKFIWVK